MEEEEEEGLAARRGRGRGGGRNDGKVDPTDSLRVLLLQTAQRLEDIIIYIIRLV